MYLLYGAGNAGKGFVEYLHTLNIDDFVVVDSDENKVGKEICGHRIVALKDVHNDQIELAVITVDERYYSEVFDILKKSDISAPIVGYKEVVIINESDVVDLGSLKISNKIEPGIYEYNQLISYFDEASFNDLESFFYKSDHRIIHKFIHYMEAYDRFFSSFRNRSIKVLEIGVFRGGSLQMWKNYFGPDAVIYGVDIDEKCERFKEDNIDVIIGDQADDVFLNELKEKIGSVDIIIDDGGHTMEQQIKSFAVLFDMITEGGIYLCEDTHTSYWKEYGGGFKKSGTFIEYSKDLIDLINEQYYDSKSLVSPYRGKIRSISFYDSMVFIEKKKYSNRSIALKQGNMT